MTISRREMLKYCGGAGAAAVMGSPCVHSAVAQVSRPPIGLALCIGLNSVDPDKYRGWQGVLRGCVPDAEFMSSIFRQPQASGSAFKVRTLWDQPTAQAKQKPDDVGTIANVKKYVRRAAQGTGGRAGLQAGDIFVLTYSGHGSQRPDFNGDEPDGQDETWCLYDGEMVDDERAELWTLFNPGVRIVVISDSCHSGTMAKAVLFQDAFLNEARDALQYDASTAAPSTVRSRGLDAPSIDKEMDFLKSSFERLGRRSRGGPAEENLDEPSPIRQMPDWLRKKLDTDPNYQSQARDQTAKIPPKVAQLQAGQLKTRVLAIGACQDTQTAGDLANNGLFTARLKQVWNAKQFKSYGDFFSSILRLMPDHQKPNLDVFGLPEPNIEAMRPFSI